MGDVFISYVREDADIALSAAFQRDAVIESDNPEVL
jgi:hypothetical protein